MKGATPEEWRVFRDIVTDANLLPVAPDGEPAELSRLSSHNIGKVPSRYNKDGAVVGIKDWTAYTASVRDVNTWSQGRYSVSIITGREIDNGRIYALDIDTSDEALQDKVYEVLLGFMPAGFPWRTRSNSARRLYPLLVNAQMAKRVLGLGQEDGKPAAIELLGMGQQFVAAGTHPSGARYVWRDIPFLDDDTMPQAFPAITGEAFERLWLALQNTLPVISSSEARASKSRKLSGRFATDETAEYLDAEGYTMSAGNDGERYLRSPRAHLYSSAQDEGDTSLCYFPAGCGGFERGHFVSLHASDADLTDTDWLNEFGVVVDEFEELPEENYDDTPTFRERDKKGKVPATLSNLVMAVSSKTVMGMSFRYDTFTQSLVVIRKGKRLPLTDSLVSQLNVHLQDNWRFHDVGSKKLDEAIGAVAWRDKFDSLTEWVDGLVWDGKPRCETFFSDVWDLPQDEYHHAVGAYFWTALAGRALVPGIQADMAPVLISAQQGKGKSKALRAIHPNPEAFVALDFAESRTERVRKLLGRCIVELEEMQGMGRREIGEIRSFMTETVDTQRNPYERRAVDTPRRCVFVATTNDETPFNDSAGNRRWLPMTIADDFDPAGVVSYIEANRAQLWAEAREMFKKHGVMWVAAQTLAQPRLNQYEAVSDSTETRLMRFLASSTMEGNGDERWCDRQEVSNADIIDGAFPNAGVKERAIIREVGVMMRRLGYEYRLKKSTGKRRWVTENPPDIKGKSDKGEFDSLH